MTESAIRIVVFAGSARVYDPAEPDCHLPVVADRLSRRRTAIRPTLGAGARQYSLFHQLKRSSERPT
ncbi:MAG TPA: hypothetical protein DCE55_16245 [Planctomycetaceae bacterium]|nr:hypothetical protein [Planctomycetaceae bacterium]